MLKNKKLKEEDKDKLFDYGKEFSFSRENTLMQHIMSLRLTGNYIILIYVLLVAFILYSSHTPKHFIGE